MASIQASDQKKWINGAVALFSIIVGYISLSFIERVGDWLELESKIGYYTFVVQGVAITIALATFLVVTNHQKVSAFLKDVYAELIKVVWPDGQANVRHSIGIIIGVTIVGFILFLFDVGVGQLLNLIYKL